MRAAAREVVLEVVEADTGQRLTDSYMNLWFYSPIKGS